MYCLHSIFHYTSIQSCQQDKELSTDEYGAVRRGKTPNLTLNNAETLLTGGVIHLTNNLHTVWDAKVHQNQTPTTQI